MAAWFEKKSVETPAAKAPLPAARISELLSEETILIAAEGAGKDALLESVVARLCGKNGLGEPRPLIEKVLERERGISTTLDTGLSLPHARLDALERICAAMALVPGGLADPKQPELSIRVVFLFFSPNKQEFFPRHLQLLRSVSTLFKPALIEELSRAKTPADALGLIRRAEA